jgi:hypothetical protein
VAEDFLFFSNIDIQCGLFAQFLGIEYIPIKMG